MMTLPACLTNTALCFSSRDALLPPSCERAFFTWIHATSIFATCIYIHIYDIHLISKHFKQMFRCITWFTYLPHGYIHIYDIHVIFKYFKDIFEYASHDSHQLKKGVAASFLWEGFHFNSNHIYVYHIDIISKCFKQMFINASLDSHQLKWDVVTPFPRRGHPHCLSIISMRKNSYKIVQRSYNQIQGK